MDLSVIFEDAKRTIEESGSVQGTLYAFYGDGSVTKLRAWWSDDIERLLVIGALSVYLNSTDAMSYSILSEVWMSEVDPEDVDEAPRPSEDPNRKEALMMVTVAKGNPDVHGTMYKILRRDDGVKFEDMKNHAGIGGGDLTKLLKPLPRKTPEHVVEAAKAFLYEKKIK